MPPEMVQKREYTEKIDIWAVGIMTSILITGHIPLDPCCYDLMDKEIAHKPHLNGIQKFAKHGRLAKDFIDKCLQKNPNLRQSAVYLLEHEWFEEFSFADKKCHPESEKTNLDIKEYLKASKFFHRAMNFRIGM